LPLPDSAVFDLREPVIMRGALPRRPALAQRACYAPMTTGTAVVAFGGAA